MARSHARSIHAAATPAKGIFAALCAALVRCSVAFPSYGLRVPNGRRVQCPEGVGGCSDGEGFLCQPSSVCNGLGHGNCAGGTLPLNPFGQALVDNDFIWTKELCEGDSDGDGLTNGEELGDPCCLWKESDEPSNYAKAFSATHPGFANSAGLVASYKRPASCGETAPAIEAPPINRFNEGEVQKSVDVRIDGFPIPSGRTTYVDIALNWPDNSSELFHIVSAHVLLDKKKNLHHFVIRGCSDLFPEELHGKRLPRRDRARNSCGYFLGGWTPGAHILETLPHVGVPIGSAAGIRALWLNVHYDNPDLESGLLDSSGIRFHYTTSLRPHSARGFNIAQVSFNPIMQIPPGAKRWFLTRTCHLEVTNKTTNEPAEFHIYGVSYHAHLLGREMYAELKRGDQDEFQDLASAASWHFDDQGMQNIGAWNISLRTGDTLQTSCVMDSRPRSTGTFIGTETTDEMCWAMIRGWPLDVDLQCTGEVWDGQLAQGEPGLGLIQRHPLVDASNVWDGTDAQSGGAIVRIDVSAWSCADHHLLGDQCKLMLFLVSAADDPCGTDLPGTEAMFGVPFTMLEACCETACETLCPENPRCGQTDQQAAAPLPFSWEGVVLQEPRCWAPALGLWGGSDEDPDVSSAWSVSPPSLRKLPLLTILLLASTFAALVAADQ